jgi:high-affinity iron transporter
VKIAGRHSTVLRILFAFMVAVLGITGLSLASTPASAASAKEALCDQGSSNPDGSSRTYQDYALCMSAQLDYAREAITDGDTKTAYDRVNDAYFKWYENLLEPASMTLPGNRKVKMEGRFTRLKLAINAESDASQLNDMAREIQVGVARDAMVLDGVLDRESPESAGEKLLKSGSTSPADDTARNSVDFVTAFGLLLREGLEALLVVVAIALYLVKAGQHKLVKAVYIGAGAGAVASAVLAAILLAALGGAGQASELLEGATMFLAVGMLFYVSNWMLSKSSGDSWKNYIQDTVEQSVSKGAARMLIGVAFLAVFREGAELVLFFVAAFAGQSHSALWAALGLLAGFVALAVIFVAIRYGGVRLPIGKLFYITSILLFALCLSFVGKGVQAFNEAGVVLGETNLPWMHYYFPDLGIFPRAETLLPQLILLVASIWIIVSHTLNGRRERKKQQSESKKAEGALQE